MTNKKAIDETHETYEQRNERIAYEFAAESVDDETGWFGPEFTDEELENEMEEDERDRQERIDTIASYMLEVFAEFEENDTITQEMTNRHKMESCSLNGIVEAFFYRD